MKDSLVWHALVGNDAPVWLVAAVRGVLSALIVGSLSFLAVWQGTDDIKVLVSSFLVPFLTVIGTRFGLETVIDTKFKP